MRARLLDGIDEADFLWLARLASGADGRVLGSVEHTEERLAPMLWRRHVPGFGALIRILREEPDGLMAQEALERLTCSGTWFFDEPHPTGLLKERILPDLTRSRSEARALQGWSVGCGGGQEAYSLAILVRHYYPLLAPWRLRILGTDPSQDNVDQAWSASYSKEEVGRGLPLALLSRHFEAVEGRWQVGEAVKKAVAFETLDLESSWPDLPGMDLVLMRGVLGAYDPDIRQVLLRKVAAQMTPGGWLLLGPGEDVGPVPGCKRVGSHYGMAWRRESN